VNVDKAKLIEKLQQLRKQAADAMDGVDNVTSDFCGHTDTTIAGCDLCTIFVMADRIGANLARMGNAIDRLAKE